MCNATDYGSVVNSRRVRTVPAHKINYCQLRENKTDFNISTLTSNGRGDPGNIKSVTDPHVFRHRVRPRQIASSY